MKTLFAIILAILALASVYTYRSLPGVASDVPVLYWVTDPNPARSEQVRTFGRWLEKNNYPRIDLRIDAVNVANEKILVQGVSGVCADIIGHTGGGNMRFRQAVGLLEDVTDWAKELGFSPEFTYKAMEPEITVNGRQYAFPCNVFASMFWVNLEVFEKYGVEPPARRWTVEDFERIGRELVTRANPAGAMRRYFFIPGLEVTTLMHSLGGSVFNETQSGCTLGSEEAIRAFEKRYQWTYVDRLIPSAAEISSFSTEGGYGGASFQLFNSGNYAMVLSGRYALIQLRRFTAERIAANRPAMKLAVVEPPHVIMPTTSTGTRAAAIYAGSPHKDLAKYFLAFLASEDYNMNIVDDADALPPNPVFTQTEEFLRPVRYPNEWGCHEAFSEAAMTIAAPNESSPFVLDTVANRVISETTDKFMNNRLSIPEAAAEMVTRIEDEIQRGLAEQPDLMPLYRERLAIQKQIEAMRREGRKVPLSLITNPFHRQWYQFHGWADETK